MIWDVPHHRGAGFPLAILRPAGAYLVLAQLCERPRQSRADLLDRLAESNAADVPFVGLRELSDAMVSGTLSYLRSTGLIAWYGSGGLGIHTRYRATSLGRGLIGALRPITEWAMADVAFVVSATRVRFDLPPLDHPVATGSLSQRSATGLALGLLSGVWSDTVMVYIDSAGPDGIGMVALENTVNAAIDASSGKNQVVKHLHRDSLSRHLHRLVAKGLLARVEDPPRVWYMLTSHGRGLMDAWWQVSDGWAMAHDAELFEIMARVTNWFPRASET